MHRTLLIDAHLGEGIKVGSEPLHSRFEGIEQVLFALSEFYARVLLCLKFHGNLGAHVKEHVPRFMQERRAIGACPSGDGTDIREPFADGALHI